MVEDNPDVRRLVLRQLRDLGYQVIEAMNGPEALQILLSKLYRKQELATRVREALDG